jgi:peptidoglycan/LPS O-acetylase OafA/YrhL
MKDKIYFRNLNGLRFIAALLVVICHIELNKKYFNLPNSRELLKQLGVLGVDLFFVLSGFLITFLLLKEKQKFSTINFKNFYFRRILRIWPLYYFIVLLSIFVLPEISILDIPNNNLDFDSSSELLKVLLLFILLLPNALLCIKAIPFAAQSWSIGTEEQFYLIWPWIVDRLTNLKKWFFFIFSGYLILYYLISFSFLDEIKYITFFRSYYGLFKVDVLSVGAFSAVLLFDKDKFLSKICTIPVFIFCCLAILFLYTFSNIFVIERIVYSILFAIIILNLVNNSQLENLLENKVLNYLGQISYGIYMYHQIVIVFLINTHIVFIKGSLNNYLIYPLSMILTIVLSHLSYQLLEKYFLRIKLRFSPFSNEK